MGLVSGKRGCNGPATYPPVMRGGTGAVCSSSLSPKSPPSASSATSWSSVEPVSLQGRSVGVGWRGRGSTYLAGDSADDEGASGPVLSGPRTSPSSSTPGPDETSSSSSSLGFRRFDVPGVIVVERARRSPILGLTGVAGGFGWREPAV
jgi:hypothetical protein